MDEPTYQQTVDLGIDLPHGMRPLTAEYFVDWLIQYKGLPAEVRDNVISNLKNDYAKIELQGALKHALAHPQVVVEFSLFGGRSGK